MAARRKLSDEHAALIKGAEPGQLHALCRHLGISENTASHIRSGKRYSDVAPVTPQLKFQRKEYRRLTGDQIWRIQHCPPGELADLADSLDVAYSHANKIRADYRRRTGSATARETELSAAPPRATRPLIHPDWLARIWPTSSVFRLAQSFTTSTTTTTRT